MKVIIDDVEYDIDEVGLDWPAQKESWTGVESSTVLELRGKKGFLNRYRTRKVRITRSGSRGFSAWPLLESLHLEDVKGAKRTTARVLGISERDNRQYYITEDFDKPVGDEWNSIRSQISTKTRVQLVTDVLSAFKDINARGFWHAHFSFASICQQNSSFFLKDIDSAFSHAVALNRATIKRISHEYLSWKLSIRDETIPGDLVNPVEWAVFAADAVGDLQLLRSAFQDRWGMVVDWYEQIGAGLEIRSLEWATCKEPNAEKAWEAVDGLLKRIKACVEGGFERRARPFVFAGFATLNVVLATLWWKSDFKSPITVANLSESTNIIVTQKLDANETNTEPTMSLDTHVDGTVRLRGPAPWMRISDGDPITSKLSAAYARGELYESYEGAGEDERLCNVSVSVMNGSDRFFTKTDSNGRFSITLPPGKHTLTFKHPEAEDLEENFWSRGGVMRVLDVSMEKSAQRKEEDGSIEVFRLKQEALTAHLRRAREEDMAMRQAGAWAERGSREVAWAINGELPIREQSGESERVRGIKSRILAKQSSERYLIRTGMAKLLEEDRQHAIRLSEIRNQPSPEPIMSRDQWLRSLGRRRR